jgi:mannose-6-phosphate isomerase-like protein (cupin superfamily)
VKSLDNDFSGRQDHGAKAIVAPLAPSGRCMAVAVAVAVTSHWPRDHQAGQDGRMGREQSHNIEAVLADISEHWSPRTVAVVNDYDVRVVKVQGEFTQHRHIETDEFFLVLSGQLTIRMETSEVVLNQGDTYVVPRGVVHQPCAEVETTLLLFEPSETVNTGGSPGAMTAPRTVI